MSGARIEEAWHVLQRNLQEIDKELEGQTPILVIDDESVILGLLEACLGDAGFDVHTASSVEDALTEFEKHSFPLVLTDKNMPGATGIDLLRQVKDRSPATEVVIMTGYANIETALEAMDLGAYDYLLKPFDHPDLVVKRCNAALSRWREAQRIERLLERTAQKEGDLLRDWMAGLEDEPESGTVLVGDRGTLVSMVEKLGHTVIAATTPDDFLSGIDSGGYDAVLVGDRASPLPPGPVVQRVHGGSPEAEVLLFAQSATLHDVLEAFEAGAFDCIVRNMSGVGEEEAILRRKLTKAVARVHANRVSRRLLEGLMERMQAQ